MPTGDQRRQAPGLYQVCVAGNRVPHLDLDAVCRDRTTCIVVYPELEVAIVDTTTQVVLATITGVKCTSRSMTSDARGVMTETLNFVGRVLSDESGAQSAIPVTQR